MGWGWSRVGGAGVGAWGQWAGEDKEFGGQ